MARSNYQGNWRGARRYRFDEETRRKRARIAGKPTQRSSWQWLRSLPAVPLALLLIGTAGAGFTGFPLPLDQAKAMLPGSGCAIKGNISVTGERIYHVPGQQYYRDTAIAVYRGERWFCSESDARSAGWRRSRV